MATYVEALETDRRLLWNLCYRMTGSAADADDLVQETFVRAIEKPPRRTNEPLRPWLVRVAMNLSRDLLRRRKRRHYLGPWLPSPVPTDEESPASYEPPAPRLDSPAARYDLKESISFAFLVALEALTPSQRAVLLLRDVFDYSTGETAGALDLTEANVKVTLLRARRKMKEYDRNPGSLDATHQEATRRALEQFLLYLGTRDAEGIERLLAEDVISISDGGPDVNAARMPVRGRDKVLRLILGLAAKVLVEPRFTIQMLNGLPSISIEDLRSSATAATRYTVQVDVDDAGRIRRLYAVLAPRKLSAVRFTS
ncbi:MAG TPA: sigma-70 family RNA polymerase sigma factor [Blastocatellia bacterium]|nr:sigma-70 family RNA polymerase sigma factor [Blastocatellia bacterium]